MRNRGSSIYLRIVTLFFSSIAIILTVITLVQYSRLRSNYSPQMVIAGVPVGGLDPQAAAQRLLQVYSLPVEIHYGEAIIQLESNLVGFHLELESMLAAADIQRTGASFWVGFWDYLWNRKTATSDVPLLATYSEERLRAYLKGEIAARYDQPPIPAQPIPGSTEFLPGQPGQTIDIGRAVILIEGAMRSPSQRVVMLAPVRTAPGRPSLQNLQLLLQGIIAQNGFDGIVGMYLRDLQSAEELHFAYMAGENLPVNPDIAFTASSTIKIPIMVAAFRRFDGRLDEQTANLMLDMIKKSENPPSDALMRVIDEARGPLVVSETMKALGLENTFLAGYFYEGAPVLQVFRTPANQRTDISTDPDFYSQTTTSDIGALLEDIYQCAQTGGGTLLAAFPAQIDQISCQQMVEYLKEDKIGVLIQAGVPEGTAVAHKHGWVTDPGGVIHNVSDAAIVYTPSGNYILAIYVYHPTQIVWDQVSKMYADLSRAIYNYFNLPAR
ncbi:MAG: serine hydrolase [Anaerolineales bacterium]|nr:serine hydrolase [Anaerolineales bacterium]